jgi:glycosyltransferase involved in cell wall biosynthesis
MKISIIIPAKNEEELLPRLLQSIKEQDFDDYEVIVADAGSTDRTREIAEEYGARVTGGGLPAAGRNAGAKVASGEFLVFLDADVTLPEHFLKDLYNEMQDRYIDVATCGIKPLSDIQLDRIIHKLMNMIILANLRLDPKAFGFCIFITSRLFNRIGGFDETIKVAEDNDLVKRAAEFRPLRYLNSTFIHVSVRRFEKEGRLNYTAKGIGLNLYRLFRGEIRLDNDVVNYNFGGYGKEKEKKNTLDRIESGLINMEKSYRRRIAEARKLHLSKSEKEENKRLLLQLREVVQDVVSVTGSGEKEEEKN